jgi:predicted nucleic acid-binding protein
VSAGIYADTSLLFPLYLADANTPAALAAMSAAAAPLFLTSWQQFELENAFQLRVFRRECSRADLDLAETRLANDLSAGLLIGVELPIDSVLPVARQLTARHTALVGTRALDAFHVAAALHLKASRFLPFDARQLALARAAPVAPSGGVTEERSVPREGPGRAQKLPRKPTAIWMPYSCSAYSFAYEGVRSP